MEQRVTTFSEFVMAVVNDVVESHRLANRQCSASVIKISFQPQVHIDAAIVSRNRRCRKLHPLS